MNKLILVLAAIALTGSAFAQSDSTNKKMSPPDINNSNDNRNKMNDRNNTMDDRNPNRDMNKANNGQDPQNSKIDKSRADGITMKNGQIMKIKNGQMTALDQDMTFSNGTKITRNGTCTKKDGSKVMLKEGEHIDMSGNMVDARSSKDKDMYLVPDSTRKR